MKTLLGILCASALTTGVFAQGLVAFNNTPATLVSQGFYPGGVSTVISGAAGSFYFGLLTSPNGQAGTFTFSGNYATNSGTAAGQFIGGTQAVNGWVPGTTTFYEVAGWSGSLGPVFQPGWLTGIGITDGSFFGTSNSASGAAGGGTPPISPFPLFSDTAFGGAGISSGFELFGPILVPEPTSMALAGLGAAALWIFRLRKPASRAFRPTSTCSLTPR